MDKRKEVNIYESGMEKEMKKEGKARGQVRDSVKKPYSQIKEKEQR